MISGTYTNNETKGYIELKSDGTFYFSYGTGGSTRHGRYEIDNDKLRLIFDPQLGITEIYDVSIQEEKLILLPHYGINREVVYTKETR